MSVFVYNKLADIHSMDKIAIVSRPVLPWMEQFILFRDRIMFLPYLHK